jgi:hypothetical protein
MRLCAVLCYGRLPVLPAQVQVLWWWAILGRMLGSDSRRALTIVPMLPHKNPFVQVGPDGELLAVDDSFVACAREVRISYALFCATFD